MSDMEAIIKSADGRFSVTFRRVIPSPSNNTGDYFSVFAIEMDENGNVHDSKLGDIASGFIETADMRAILDLFPATIPAYDPEPAYMADAPAIMDDDAPDDATAEETYAPYVMGEDIMSETYPHELTREDIIGADTLGFERGYAAAVDDMRHGLMADEVTPNETARDMERYASALADDLTRATTRDQEREQTRRIIDPHYGDRSTSWVASAETPEDPEPDPSDADDEDDYAARMPDYYGADEDDDDDPPYACEICGRPGGH